MGRSLDYFTHDFLKRGIIVLILVRNSQATYTYEAKHNQYQADAGQGNHFLL